MRSLFCAVALLLSSSPALSAPEAMAGTEGCYRIERLLDPAQSAAVVDREMAKLRLAASRGQPFAAYLLGTLYRLGPAHPARRLERDPDEARVWLRKSALGGHLTAMAGLAENELAAGRPMDAMIMAQVMIHYADRYPQLGAAHAKKYQAGLVARAFEAMDRVPTATHDREILAAFKAFLAEHGGEIEAGINHKPAEPRTCPPFHDNELWPLAYVGRSHVMGSARSSKVENPGYALFHVVVRPNGRAESVLVVDSLPGVEVSEALRNSVDKARFSKLRGAPPRAALFPMTL